MKEHDELSIHGDTDVVGELGHNAALHFGFAVRVWNKQNWMNFLFAFEKDTYSLTADSFVSDGLNVYER